VSEIKVSVDFSLGTLPLAADSDPPLYHRPEFAGKGKAACRTVNQKGGLRFFET
jgi:hypothetical protein